jgi:predicted phage tail protein
LQTSSTRVQEFNLQLQQQAEQYQDLMSLKDRLHKKNLLLNCKVQELESALEQCKQQHNGQLTVLESELREVHIALQDERAVTNSRTEHAEQLAQVAQQKLHEAALLQERMMEAMSKEQAAKFEAQIASKQVQLPL